MHQTSIKYSPKPGDLIHLSLMDQVILGLVLSVRKCDLSKHRKTHFEENKKLYDYSLKILFNGRIRKFPDTFVELVQR